MATLAKTVTTVDMSGYTSNRVFDGVRQLDAQASANQRARLKRALAKLQAETTN